MANKIEINSTYLKRTVRIDIYLHEQLDLNNPIHVLVVNDGQDLVTMDFENMLNCLAAKGKMKPMLVAGIHCGADRNHEYGMSVGPDFKGWGSKAVLYEKFVLEELLPAIKNRFSPKGFQKVAYAGFSLGALSALDIAWNHPEIFSEVGVFSGSLWWRSVDKSDRNYDAWKHRMMHLQVAQSPKRSGMKFFFECGELDEEEDRNRNGVIDSIDDTIDIMRLLLEKGYKEGKDFQYLQLPDGRHDVASWAKAFPKFLEWL